MKRDLFTSWSFALITILFSGICWWFAFDLNGGYGWLLCIAPVPVLLVAYTNAAWKTFLVAFTAYLIGRAHWYSYLISVAPSFLAIIYTLFLPLVFAVAVLASRRIMRQRPHWSSALAFPVFVTAFEYLSFVFSHDGSFGSLAYSVADILPLVQLASVTGILGISFILCFIPSMAAAWIHSGSQNKIRRGLIPTFITVALSVLLFGFWRLSTYSPAGSLRIGMVVIDEKDHWLADSAGVSGNKRVAKEYARQIPGLVAKGATVILLPENIVDASEDAVMDLFKKSAQEQQVSLIIGYRVKRNGQLQNRAAVIRPSGDAGADYQKKNLFEGEILDGFTAGNGDPATFALDNVASALAICKDMDFPAYIRKAHTAKPALFFTPAWDFDRDGLLHARMAVLRGVENGYTLIRNARRGYLTMSDSRGKILFIASSVNDKATSLIGDMPYSRTNSFYASTGDWFGIINVALTAFLLLISFTKRNKAAFVKKP